MQDMKSRFTREILSSGAVMVIALLFAASAFTARAEALLKPTVNFKGAPATAANGSTFSVTATTNDGTTATITATGSCTVPAGSTGGTVTVTMTKNSTTCSLKASWPATATYLAATATQKTIATLGYTESDLYYFGTDFGANGDDGEQPNFNGMVFDTSGNIYASTARDFNNGSGAIVKLSPAGGGVWNETLIYVFNRTSTTFSGWIPQGSLAMDSKGNIYGTTRYGGGVINGNTGDFPCGGVYGCGTAYELSPNPDGGLWMATDLHDFGVNDANDGITPQAGVTLASTAATVLYGATSAGGNVASGCSTGPGTIYELSKEKSGSWQETILYRFPQDPLNQQGYCPAPNGFGSSAGLLLKSGNLFGTTLSGGVNSNGDMGVGVLFKLSPGTSGWTFNQLYVFCPEANNPTYTVCPEGGAPGHGTVAMDSKGNLYGTTVDVVFGGVNEPSTVWELPYSSTTESYANQVKVIFNGSTFSSNQWIGGVGQWIVPYKNSWYTTEYTAASGTNPSGGYCCSELVSLTNSATGWKATPAYQFPPYGVGSGLNTLYGFSNQLIVDKVGHFYSQASAGGPASNNGQNLGDGGIFEFSPLP